MNLSKLGIMSLSALEDIGVRGFRWRARRKRAGRRAFLRSKKPKSRAQGSKEGETSTNHTESNALGSPIESPSAGRA